ncbi:MAG: alpha/beta fold hydrolase [Acidobacteria bacterium]|nr:alpha/beta fold hydrolase [Acidobacteriota bacterium]
MTATPTLMPGAEPWGSDGGEAGVLVLHGFTGCPQSVRPWAEGLSARGLTTALPRLPGHGTDLKDFASTGWRDWTGEAEMALRGLRERCSSVFVAGLSMGGTIAIDLAARFPDSVAGLIVVNASVHTTDPRAKLAPLLARLPISVKGVGNDVADPAARELCYPRIPTRAAAQFLEYQALVRARLESVRAPALVFVSRQDHVVATTNAAEIHARISSTDKELVWLERSYHVATLDYDRDLIVERSAEFVAKHSRGSGGQGASGASGPLVERG